VRIVMAGSSGFLGTQLTRALRADGHEVVRLVRREPSSAGEVRWDPASRVLDPTVLSTVDAVVNLAGATVGRRWTQAYKRTLRSSRIDSTGTLAEAAAAAPHRPAVLLNASGVGFYGDTGDRTVDETAPAGHGFLADLAKDWEATTTPARDAGVRVALLRTGLPLDVHGGFLPPVLVQFRLFAGGRLGSGRQYVPWISLADWLGAVRFLLDNDSVSGPVNLTGPLPVTNAEFTRALAETVHRPAVLPVPGIALRLVLGEFGGEALAGQRAVPEVLTRAGYRFQHEDVRAALRAALDR
jgi:uncharacterized protein (TIGR01777 family)